MEVFGYRKLVAYQKAKEVVKMTYKLIKKFPSDERYAMCDQLRRASVSITSNIAEGINRYSAKDKAHFIEMAYGSLMEVSSQFEIAEDLKYINIEDRSNYPTSPVSSPAFKNLIKNYIHYKTLNLKLIKLL